MPLRLKSLELHGYKTFAVKTNFEFAKGITAIVGPNGSGKSNIADAVRWVLGEQSYSILRAKKTEDMIFAGSEQRPRSGMASAGLIFDNSDNWLPVDFSEVSLSRRAYRDGRNEYLLNSQHVRLKDINELLAQSGLSERTYTILGQGLVDASLALKADERRRLFEEAAGIGLYRSRREETLRRLETTKRNLDRVLDILAELEPRLKSLERQASKAREYSQLQADLRALLLNWYGYHWHKSQNELTEILEVSRVQEVKHRDARNAYETIRQSFSEYRDRVNGLRARLNSWHRQSAQLHESRESTSGELAKLEERERSLLENRMLANQDQARITEESSFAKQRLAEIQQETSRLEAEYNEAMNQLQKVQNAYDERRTDKELLEKNMETARKNVEELVMKHTTSTARLHELTTRKEALLAKKEEIQNTISLAEKEFQTTVQKHKEILESLVKLETSNREKGEKIETSRENLSGLEKELKEKQTSRNHFAAEEAKLKAQLEILDQAEQSFVGYAEGAKLLLTAARQSRIKGSRGALSSVLEIPEEFEMAVSSVLGEYADAVIIDSGRETEQALEILEGDNGGRATILPLDLLNPPSPVKPKSDAGCLGIAADIVKVSPDYRPAVDLLLGQVLIARDRKTAKRLISGYEGSVKVVTLQGEVFHATGQILAGKAPSTGKTISRHRERKEIQESLQKIEQKLSALDGDVSHLNHQMEKTLKEINDQEKSLSKEQKEFQSIQSSERDAQVKEELGRNQKEWLSAQTKTIELEISQSEKDNQRTLDVLADTEKEIAGEKETLNALTLSLASLTMEDIQEQINFWSTSVAVAERAVADAQMKMGEREQAFQRSEELDKQVETRLSDINTSLSNLEIERENLRNQSAQMNLQLEEIRKLIEPAEKELESTEGQEENLKKQEMESQAGLARVERTYNQVQLELGRKQEMLEGLRRKIEDDFGLVAFQYASDVAGPVPLPLEGMVEKLPLISVLPSDLEENMNRLRAQLRRMGAINPDAQQEFLSVKERHAFLTTQMEDLHKAEADMHQVIMELDDLTRQEFKKTFDQVADHFHEIFHRLFGGGNAKLVLTDPENLTETGIDIEARLPGRREQGLALLSGGERSLTAIGLVFALLKVSPTPVCVMDEVDAMLDEANVGRFRDLLLELSKETQFIIITHNRNTVQAADAIYGVTMGRDSTSQVISLKLDEVSEEYLR